MCLNRERIHYIKKKKEIIGEIKKESLTLVEKILLKKFKNRLGFFIHSSKRFYLKNLKTDLDFLFILLLNAHDPVILLDIIIFTEK